MRQPILSILILVISLLIISTVTSCQSITETQGTSTATQLPLTATFTRTLPPPTMTETEGPPSQTPTITQQPTETATITPSPTLTATETPTEVPPVVGIFGGTICREGPGTIYPLHKSFLEGTSAYVQGRLQDNSWYYIQLMDDGSHCWIFNEIVTLDRTPDGMPVMTPPPKPTPAPAPTADEAEEALGVKYFLIIPETGGPFGCGDGIAYFYTGSKVPGGPSEKIKAALNALLDVPSKNVGKYYNPVYRSTLRVRKVDVDGAINIYMSGKLIWDQTDCEAKQIRDQIWETAKVYANGKHIYIWVNNVPLGDLLENVKK